jgi:hypothetical protein
MRTVAKWALLGLLWGVLVRAFMRSVATDPAFSWSGTAFIIGLFVVAGTAVGIVVWARERGRTRWWRLAALPALMVFAGPGAVLAPFVLVGGYAYSGRGPRIARRVAAAVMFASPVPGLLALDPQVPEHLLVATLLLGLTVAGMSLAVGEVWRPWRAARREPATELLLARREGASA